MRILKIAANLLILNTLVACGPPGTDSLFSKKPKPNSAAGADTAAKAREPQQKPIQTSIQKGLFRFTGDSMLFRPCGSRLELPVYGSPMAMFRIRERVRWVGVWLNTPLFAVFDGASVVDTPTVKDAGSDSTTRGEPRIRFMVVEFDTLRAVKETDCNGMRKR